MLWQYHPNPWIAIVIHPAICKTSYPGGSREDYSLRSNFPLTVSRDTSRSVSGQYRVDLLGFSRAHVCGEFRCVLICQTRFLYSILPGAALKQSHQLKASDRKGSCLKPCSHLAACRHFRKWWQIMPAGCCQAWQTAGEWSLAAVLQAAKTHSLS